MSTQHIEPSHARHSAPQPRCGENAARRMARALALFADATRNDDPDRPQTGPDDADALRGTAALGDLAWFGSATAAIDDQAAVDRLGELALEDAGAGDLFRTVFHAYFHVELPASASLRTVGTLMMGPRLPDGAAMSVDWSVETRDGIDDVRVEALLFGRDAR
ncbi:hypothetical protein JS528_10795 [Bifidobacterium sp. MA2]|uniref:SnoaL-like domain-containing protein n=1 Tax=Bifidobacterium santillanense TaxID=2809028 RepID=A0ABS5US33_9BIFI|nr:hypothetical protein [Bifidobacterium santillanense]MBT1173811.1 hypothetical protein [Bifidobacterium santillanense]